MKTFSKILIFSAVLVISVSAKTDDTLNPEKAMSIARQLVGANTVQVRPFKNADSSHQFIAVETRDPTVPDYSNPSKIAILEGVSGFYRLHKTTLNVAPDDSALYGSAHSKKLNNPAERWGIIDIDGDGTHEIFAIDASFGSGMGSHHIELYDIKHETLNSAVISYSWGRSPEPVDIETVPSPSQKSVSDWLLTRSASLIADLGLSPQDDEVAIWERMNGKGLYQGAIKIRRFPGKLPFDRLGSLVCELSDGHMIWYSFFKDAVYAYDRNSNSHFVVYAPSNIYEYPNGMVAGKNYLWLGITVPANRHSPSDRSILAYHKSKAKLENIPITNLGEILCKKNSTDCGDDPDAIQGGLSLSNGKLVVNKTPLNLPKGVDKDELASGKNCKE